MKKTLITLAAALAAASVASAEVTSENVTLDVNNPTGTISGGISTASGEFTMILVLDWDVAVEKFGDWQSKTDLFTLGGTWSVAGDSWKNGLTMFDGGSNNTNLYVGIRTDVATNDDDGTPKLMTLTKGTGSTWASDTDYKSMMLEKGTYGITVNGTTKLVLAYTMTTDNYLQVSALKADGTLGTAYALAKGQSGDGDAWNPSHDFDTMTISAPEGVILSALAFNTVLTTDEIISYATAAVPEPATATLSLLALAGLAARRRRK